MLFTPIFVLLNEILWNFEKNKKPFLLWFSSVKIKKFSLFKKQRKLWPTKIIPYEKWSPTNNFNRRIIINKTQLRIILCKGFWNCILANQVQRLLLIRALHCLLFDAIHEIYKHLNNHSASLWQNFLLSFRIIMTAFSGCFCQVQMFCSSQALLDLWTYIDKTLVTSNNKKRKTIFLQFGYRN